MSSPQSRKGGNGGGGRGRTYVKVDNLLNFQFAPSKEKLLSADSDWRDVRDHHPAPAVHTRRVDPAAIRNAFLVQAFQFVLPRSAVGGDELRVALESWRTPWASVAPSWSIVKYVVSRGPYDDHVCPICLDPPTAPVASTACGHIYCCACAYEFFSHHRDKVLNAEKQQHRPASSPIVSGTQYFPPASVSGSRASVHSQHAPCPMCGVSTSLRALVPAILVPTAAAATVGATVSFVPVRRSTRFSLTPFGADEVAHGRLCVESAATYAWTHAQVRQLTERLDQAVCDGLVASDAEERATAAWDAALEARASSAPAHLGGRSMSTVVGSASTLPSNIPPDVKSARDAKHAAEITVEATQYALERFNELLDCDIPEEETPIDVRAVYCRDDFEFGDASPYCHDEGEWTFQAADGRHIYLHPMLAKMLLETSRAAGLARFQQQHMDPVTSDASPAPAAPVDTPTKVLLPSRIDVKLQELEQAEMAHGSRHAHRSFSFAPQHATISIAFGDLGHHVSNAVRGKYRDALQARQKKRQAQLRADQHRTKAAEQQHTASVPLTAPPAAGALFDGGVGSSWEADSPPLTFSEPTPAPSDASASGSWVNPRNRASAILDAAPSLEFEPDVAEPEQGLCHDKAPTLTAAVATTSVPVSTEARAKKPPTSAADWSSLFSAKTSADQSTKGGGAKRGTSRGWGR